MIRKLAILVLFLGVVAIIFGAVFIGLGTSKNSQLVKAMQTEQVILSLHPDEEPSVIDTAGEAQAAGDLIREHRGGIAPTYQELLEGEKFDPANPKQLSYAQALNMENYLYLAVVSFGLIQSVIASGAFMIITGLALGGTGMVLYRTSQKA